MSLSFPLMDVTSPQRATPAVCASSTVTRIGLKRSVTRPMAIEATGAAFADDGRLATSSYDGKVRLYDRSFKLVATREALSGRRPARLAFRPDGKVLAIGYDDKPSVDLLDGHSLARLPGPNVDGLDNGILPTVAWSADGQTLFASGSYGDRNWQSPSLGLGPGRSRNTARNNGKVR